MLPRRFLSRLVECCGRPFLERISRSQRGARIAKAAKRFFLDRESFHDFGSSKPGNDAWAKRWASTARSKRVLMLAPKDYAGSMYKWAEALNRYSDIAARLITFTSHSFGYPDDLVVPDCSKKRLAAVLSLADQAGIFHLKDEKSWFLASEQAINTELIDAVFFSGQFKSVPKVFTHYGSYARIFKNNLDYIKHVSNFHARLAMTPDLNFDWYQGHYIPHTIDVDRYSYLWTDAKVLAHSPSNPAMKGTELLLGAVAILEQNASSTWKEWSLDLITGVDAATCMRRQSAASLFFDQAGALRKDMFGVDDVVGWYGNSAIEAMAFGIPTIAHLSEVALSRAISAGLDVINCPVMNTARQASALAHLIQEYISSDISYRQELSQRTRQFAVAFHGYASVAKRLNDIYSSLMSL